MTLLISWILTLVFAGLWLRAVWMWDRANTNYRNACVELYAIKMRVASNNHVKLNNVEE